MLAEALEKVNHKGLDLSHLVSMRGHTHVYYVINQVEEHDSARL